MHNFVPTLRCDLFHVNLSFVGKKSWPTRYMSIALITRPAIATHWHLLTQIFIKFYLIEDGLIWADEGPLVHGLLAVSQGHRVADMEQLRQEEWKSNNFHLNIQKSYFVGRNYLWDVFIMNIQRGYNFSRSYVQFFCELETIKCRVLSRSLNWLKYNNYTTFGAIICQQFS